MTIYPWYDAASALIVSVLTESGILAWLGAVFFVLLFVLMVSYAADGR